MLAGSAFVDSEMDAVRYVHGTGRFRFRDDSLTGGMANEFEQPEAKLNNDYNVTNNSNNKSKNDDDDNINNRNTKLTENESAVRPRHGDLSESGPLSVSASGSRSQWVNE